MASQSDQTVRHTRVTKDTPVASALDVRVRDAVEISLTVTNNTRHLVELRFPTGKTHDFVVFDDADREVWRWSGERLFTSAVQTKHLKSGKSVTYHTHWEPEGAQGDYVAVAMLHSTNFPVSARVPFTLP